MTQSRLEEREKRNAQKGGRGERGEGAAGQTKETRNVHKGGGGHTLRKPRKKKKGKEKRGKGIFRQSAVGAWARAARFEIGDMEENKEKKKKKKSCQGGPRVNTEQRNLVGKGERHIKGAMPQKGWKKGKKATADDNLEGEKEKKEILCLKEKGGVPRGFFWFKKKGTRERNMKGESIKGGGTPRIGFRVLARAGEEQGKKKRKNRMEERKRKRYRMLEKKRQ